MAYKKIFFGILTDTENVVAEGKCIIKSYDLFNAGLDNAEVALRIGSDYSSSLQIMHFTEIPPGPFTADRRPDGIALESGQKLFLDLLDGTGPITAQISGLKE